MYPIEHEVFQKWYVYTFMVEKGNAYKEKREAPRLGRMFMSHFFPKKNYAKLYYEKDDNKSFHIINQNLIIPQKDDTQDS